MTYYILHMTYVICNMSYVICHMLYDCLGVYYLILSISPSLLRGIPSRFEQRIRNHTSLGDGIDGALGGEAFEGEIEVF